MSHESSDDKSDDNVDEKSETIHFRRCHVCGSVSESYGAIVSRCDHCGKAMAPFFFFDDFRTLPYSDGELREGGKKRDAAIRGLTATW